MWGVLASHMACSIATNGGTPWNEKRWHFTTQCSKSNGWNQNYSLRKLNTYMYLTSWCSCCCILAAIGHPDKLRSKTRTVVKCVTPLSLIRKRSTLLQQAFMNFNWVALRPTFCELHIVLTHDPSHHSWGLGNYVPKKKPTRNVNI